MQIVLGVFVRVSWAILVRLGSTAPSMVFVEASRAVYLRIVFKIAALVSLAFVTTFTLFAKRAVVMTVSVEATVSVVLEVMGTIAAAMQVSLRFPAPIADLLAFLTPLVQRTVFVWPTRRARATAVISL
jgi:hypothetical protein